MILNHTLNSPTVIRVLGFAFPFSTWLHSSSAKTLLALNNNSASYAGYNLIIPDTSNLECPPREESHTRRGSLLATTHHIIGTDHNQDNMLQEHLACNYHAHVPSQYHHHHDIQYDLHSYHSTCDDHNICCNYFSGG